MSSRKRQPTLVVDICSSCSRLKAALDDLTEAAWVPDPYDASKTYLIAKSVHAAIGFAVRERSVQEITTIAKKLGTSEVLTQTIRSSRKRKANTTDDVELIQNLVEVSSQEDVSVDTNLEAMPKNGAAADNAPQADTQPDHNNDINATPASEAASDDEAIEDATPELLQNVTNINAGKERKKRQKRDDAISTTLDDIGDRFRRMQSSSNNIRLFDAQWSQINRFVLDQKDLRDTHATQLPHIFEAAWNVGGAALFIEWKKILTYWRAASRDSRANPTFPELPMHGWDTEPPPSSLPPSAQPDSSLPISADVKLSTLNLTRQRLKAAYQHFTASGASAQLQDVVYRNALADVYAHYMDLQKQLADPDVQSGLDESLSRVDLLTQGSKQVASLSKVELFQAAYPGIKPPGTRDDQSLAGKHWRSLGKVIEQGKRWHTLRQEWGPASLILWPSQSMSHSSLERLQQPLFTLLHRLVSRFRQDRLDLAQPLMGMFRQIATSEMPPTSLSHIECLSEEEIRAVSMDLSPNPSWLMESGGDRITELSHSNRATGGSNDDDTM